MAFYPANDPRELDITKSELKEIGEALKREEFRKLLNDYFQEINDPKNKAIYEKELTELERERGVDITFIHPEPGYVIKSSENGRKKAFINICSNEKVDKPSSSVTSQNGSPGLNWSIPYLQGHPRDDLDNKNQYCTVYDVVFHPDTLYLSKKNVRIKTLVNDIALSAVEDSFKVKLDRKNLSFPKMQYKGSKVATVIRRRRKDYVDGTEEDSEIFANCPYPYPPPKKENTPNMTTPRSNKEEGDKNLYTTPRYVIKHRKEVEMQEYTYAPDSKFHGAIPSDLVVEIDLPLVRNAADVNLDVVNKSLCLISEKPAKYKLNVNLPYDVDDEKGSAKFDKAKKKLVVILPVKRCKYNPDFVREDSGIESDVNQNNCSSSEEDIRKNVEFLQMNDPVVEICEEKQNENSSAVLRTSEEVKSQFLNPDFYYTFPDNKVTFKESLLSLNMVVENIDPQSVAHQFVNEGVHIKFCSLGAGFFPMHYAFCIRIPGIKINTSTLNIDVWDNCLSATLKIQTVTSSQVTSYYVGTSLDSLQEKEISSCEVNSIKSTEDTVKNFENQSLPVNGKSSESEIDTNFDINSRDTKYIESPCVTSENKPEEENLEIKEENSTSVTGRSNVDTSIFKNRTLSESSELPEVFTCGKRSILKGSRSLSESHTDDYNAWSSLDSESHEDLASSKKTVRFSDVVSKKIFRANSSILGQRKKNEKKSKNRKKAANERISSAGSEESETDRDECDSVSELSDVSSDDSSGSNTASSASTVIPSSKKHRRRGAKNQRKAAATAKHSHFVD